MQKVGFGASLLAALALLAISPRWGAYLAHAQVFTAPPKPATTRKPKSQPVRRSSSPARPVIAATPVQSSRTPSFRDPAAFCIANPNADRPDSSYVGPPIPGWIANAALPAGQSKLPNENIVSRFSWRCLAGRVLACQDLGGKAACTQPDQKREPSQEMLTYCSSNRNSQLPQTLTQLTVPVWVCRNGNPVINGYRSGLDQRGFFTEQWVDVTDFSPSNMVAAVPRFYIGDWKVTVKGKGFLFKIPYNAIIKIHGSRIGDIAGSVDYYSKNFSGNFVFFCASDLFLKSASPTGLIFEEKLRQRGPDGRCASQDNLSMQRKDGQVWLDWRKNGDPKVTMSGWANR